MDSYSEYSGIVYDSDGSWIQRELITGGSVCETGGKFVVIEIMNSLGNFSTSRKTFLARTHHRGARGNTNVRVKLAFSCRKCSVCAEDTTRLTPARFLLTSSRQD